MPAEVFAFEREEGQASGDDGAFFTLVYNERHAPAEPWSRERGWVAEPTTLAEYSSSSGAPGLVGDPEVGAMISAIRLVTATMA